jgi:hypothetical protein
MDIKIEIEVGDENIQNQIKEELAYLLQIAEVLKVDINISRIIVPENFQEKIREITKIQDYEMQRGFDDSKITVSAKMMESTDGIIIIIAPHNYLPSFDTMIRCFILTHELVHVMNNKNIPEIPKDSSFALKNYLTNLHQLFDEYTADRLSYLITERLFTTPTEAWKLYNQNTVLDYINSPSHPKHYAHIKSEIEKFRMHGDVELHWKSISESIKLVAMTTVHGFSSYHQHIEENIKIGIPSTAFINNRTFALMDYFKKKYENYEYNLDDGLELITDYFKNFGLEFEDRPNNAGYIYVRDI